MININQQKNLNELVFLYNDVSTKPLERVTNPDILKTIMDPTTGKPYDGIILEGEFATLGVLNNNNRVYEEDNYLPFVENLKRMIFSPKGVYGELEHPKGYASDYNNTSHKILDIWYDAKTRKVYGVIMILNVGKGLIIKEIIKSGGQVGVSARAGGSEVKNPDGTFKAVIKLMVTFDVVYHPGFTTAVSEGLVNMNESVQAGFSENDVKKLTNLYESYIDSKQTNVPFAQWAENKDGYHLFESIKKLTPEEKKKEADLETSTTEKENKFEGKLSSAVDKDLSEEEQIAEQTKQLKQQEFYQQMQSAQRSLGKKVKNSDQGKSYFDGSAGFVNTSEDEDKF